MRATSKKARRAGAAVIRGAIALAIGCGSAGQEQRYGAMLAELGRTAPRRAPAQGEGELFAGAAHLERAALVEAVLARNPDVESARLAWRAALADYPMTTALDDPMASYRLAPLSVRDDRAPFGQQIELEQRIPFAGKRRLAGEVALAEAEAMREELTSVRLELALMASNLYDDYFLAVRSLEVNQHHAALLTQMRKSAEAQYVTGRASQQDPLQADVELGNLERDRLTLEAERDATVAQLNGLLHRGPESPLPPPAAELPPPDGLDADRRELEALAFAHRPELAATRARIRGGRAAIDLARREWVPDLALMGSYDSMQDMPEHRWMLGVTVDIPLQGGRRRAARDQAEARTALERSRDRSLRDRIAVEVARALVSARESARVVELLERRLVPAARDQVRAALAGFTSGQNAFTAVIDAEENQREVELELHGARAQLWRRVAALDRAVGRVAGLSREQRGKAP
jgi:cobalt-zinc-cadmium efflux system outer membrane protein